MLRRVPRITRWTASVAIALAAAGLIIFGLDAGVGSGDIPAIDDVLSQTRQAVFAVSRRRGDESFTAAGFGTAL